MANDPRNISELDQHTPLQDGHLVPVRQDYARKTSLGDLKTYMASDLHLTGDARAPTRGQADNSEGVATTAFVKAALAAVINGAPGALDQLNELAAALGNDPNFATTVINALAGKAPNDSPALTGNARSSRPGDGDNSDRIATTGWVRSNGAVIASSYNYNGGFVVFAGGFQVCFGYFRCQGGQRLTYITYPLAFRSFSVGVVSGGATGNDDMEANGAFTHHTNASQLVAQNAIGDSGTYTDSWYIAVGDANI